MNTVCPFPCSPVSLFPFSPFPRSLFRWLTKVIAQQDANRNWCAVAHCREEMQLPNGLNCCLVQAKARPARNFNASEFTRSIEVYQDIDGGFSLRARGTLRVSRVQAAIRSREPQSLRVRDSIVVRRFFDDRSLRVDCQFPFLAFVLLFPAN